MGNRFFQGKPLPVVGVCCRLSLFRLYPITPACPCILLHKIDRLDLSVPRWTGNHILNILGLQSYALLYLIITDIGQLVLCLELSFKILVQIR